MNLEEFISKFHSAKEYGLPGEEAHQLLAPVNRLMTSTLLQRKPNYRLSAVGILCYEKNTLEN